MSNRAHDDRASRAEARRRARLVARGELPPEEPADTPDTAPEPKRGSLLQSLFPPAPPLPGRPDPLAGFERSGPMRPIRERLFLLRRTALVWILAGIAALIGYIAYRFYVGHIFGILGMFLMFGAYIAAGWFGWQRPTLVGAATGFVAFLIYLTMVVWSFASQGVGPDEFLGPGAVIANGVVELLYHVGLGFIGGWYGGYLRRRQTQISGQARRARR